MVGGCALAIGRKARERSGARRRRRRARCDGEVGAVLANLPFGCPLGQACCEASRTHCRLLWSLTAVAPAPRASGYGSRRGGRRLASRRRRGSSSPRRQLRWRFAEDDSRDVARVLVSGERKIVPMVSASFGVLE